MIYSVSFLKCFFMCSALFWVGTMGKAMNMREKSLTSCDLQSSKKRQKNVTCNVIGRDECSGVRKRECIRSECHFI